MPKEVITDKTASVAAASGGERAQQIKSQASVSKTENTRARATQSRGSADIVANPAPKVELHTPTKIEFAQPAERVIEFSEYQPPEAKESPPPQPIVEVTVEESEMDDQTAKLNTEAVIEAETDEFVSLLSDEPETATSTQAGATEAGSIVFEPAPEDEVLSIDDESLESGIEPSLADEAGELFAPAETEAGFILVPEFEPPRPELNFEITPQDIVAAEVLTEEVFQKKLQELFEPLPPQQTEDAIELVEAIVQLVAKRPEEVLEQEEAAQPEELQELCAQLFELMNIQYDEEILSKFVASISLMEIGKTETKQSAAHETGTHEQKLTNYLILRNLSLLMSQKQPRHIMLGRYALGINLASTRPKTLALAA